MTTGLRSRVMAPVYALIISFLAATLLGAVARRDDTPAGGDPAGTTGNGSVTIRLMTLSGSSRDEVHVPAPELQDAVVDVSVAGKGLKVAADGTVPLPATAASTVEVCVVLPKGWTPQEQEQVTTNGTRDCWTLVTPTGEVTLLVRKVSG